MIVDALFGFGLALCVVLPLALKWQLEVRRTTITLLVMTLASSILVGFLSLTGIEVPARPGVIALLTLLCAGGGLAYRFYRDPPRVAPVGRNVIVSPADGTVLYVRPSPNGVLPVATKTGRDYTLFELTRVPLGMADAVVIGISMTLLDVHVNRAPIAGQVTLRRHFPGRFGSLRHTDMVFENERATTVIERDDLQVAVVQIASRLVHQIVGFVKEGEEVATGQRIGAIRLGSQVELVVPARPDLRVTVSPGQHVTAGESVMAVLESPVAVQLGLAATATS
jgi:phosphatidylserine decarboxylase